MGALAIKWNRDYKEGEEVKVNRQIIFIAVLVLVSAVNGEEAYQATAKIWGAMERKNWDAAIAQANRVIRIWGPQARRTSGNSSVGIS